MSLWNVLKKPVTTEHFEVFVDGLKRLYKTKLLPLERAYNFQYFHTPQLEDNDFDSKPMIMLAGQYSTGKTTFIKHILKKDFPGMRIGPEPTTDRFISVMYGTQERIIPGNALVVDPKKQFGPLSRFGNSFLNKFQCSELNCPVLKDLTVIDTPGILSGEKQRVERGYDFTGVLKWFAERVDRVILLFDAHKLDISDEFKRCIESLQGHDDKIRIILNKSDMVDQQQLMRVYGALMWSLGKILHTPEVARVYIGSFWDEPLRHNLNKRLFEEEQRDLFKDFQSLPRNSALRKLNDFIKRARLAKVHAYIMGTIHENMPFYFGRGQAKQNLINTLDNIFRKVQSTHNLSLGDLPDLKRMQEMLQHFDFDKLQALDLKLLKSVDIMLEKDITTLLSLIPSEKSEAESNVQGGVFEIIDDASSPFGFSRGEGINAGLDEQEWVVEKYLPEYNEVFSRLKPIDGKIGGNSAKVEMIKSNLPNSVLGEIWKLADVDEDGQLDLEEFSLAMYLINMKLEGHDLPDKLPKHLYPPSKLNLCPDSASAPSLHQMK